MERMKQRQRPNRHHLLYNEFYYLGNRDLTSLREDERSIVLMDYYIHQDLHREVSFVPPVSIDMAARALKLYRDFDNTHDPISNMENLQRSIERSTNNRSDDLERSVGGLAVHALDLQKPFIKAGAMTYINKRIISV